MSDLRRGSQITNFFFTNLLIVKLCFVGIMSARNVKKNSVLSKYFLIVVL